MAILKAGPLKCRMRPRADMYKQKPGYRTEYRALP